MEVMREPTVNMSHWDSEKEEQEVGLLGRRSSRLSRQENTTDSHDDENAKTSSSSSSSSDSGDRVGDSAESGLVGKESLGFNHEENGTNLLYGVSGAESETSQVETTNPDSLHGFGSSNGQDQKEKQEASQVRTTSGDSIEEAEPEPTDLDLEKVLAEQRTYDLICPNCDACITRRVILRKRKRRPGSLRSGKYPKPEVPPQPSTPIGSDESKSEDGGDAKAEVFTCLSCFSIFFPTATGFRLFPKRRDQAAAIEGQDTTEDKKWWFSIFTLCCKETPPAQDTGIQSKSQESKPSVSEGSKEHHEPQGPDSSSTAGAGKRESQSFLTPIDKGPAAGKRPTTEGSQDNQTGTEPSPPLSTGPLQPNKGESGSTGDDKVGANQPPENANCWSFIIPSFGKPELPPKVPSLTIPKPPSQPEGTVPAVAVPMGPLEPTPRASAPDRGPEILKSIVYGGLAESVTSLGVVSSAAGSGSSTLNILVLGFANLVGGLIVIAQNLRELKKENAESVDNLTGPREDRYREMLGRRENFWLHAVLVILSYILFGLIPPVVYGFCYRETDNRDYKLIAVFAASLVGIVLLSISKSYVQRPPKSYFKTVIYYASVAVASSGISYAVGHLVGELIEKLGWFDAFPNSNPGVMGTVVDGAWARSGFASF